MKTRMRRIWLSVSLAFGTLAAPSVGFVKAHDLPTRWSSGSNSTSSWNYLLDDCLDTPVWHDVSSRSLLPTECMLNSPLAAITHLPAAQQSPLGSIASDGLITESLPRTFGSHGCVEDFDALLSRNSLARYSSEMSCWVSNWEKLQQRAGESVRRDLQKYLTDANQHAPQLAALPDDQLPPSPDEFDLRQAMLAFAGRFQPEALEDTCAFERKYMAMISSEQEGLGLSEKDLDASIEANDEAGIEANSTIDYEALVWEMAQEVDRERAALRESLAADEQLASSWQCGGHALEAIVERHPAAAVFAPNRFAPGIVDDFMQDDLSQTDMHWLGGLGKAWRLQASVRGASSAGEARAVPTNVGQPARTAEEIDAAIAATMLAPEDWIPPAVASADDEVLASHESAAEPVLPLIINASAQQLSNWAMRATESIDGYQRTAAFAWQAARHFAAPMAYHATHALPDITDGMATSVAWIEEIECILTAELCGWDSAYSLGQQFSHVASSSVKESARLSMAMVSQFATPPSVMNPEMFVIYTDIHGVDTAIPATLARAWNRPANDEVISDGDATPEPSAIDDSNSQVNSRAVLDLDALQSELLVMLARQLDAIGIACLQTADEIHSWADNQIASRNETSNR